MSRSMSTANRAVHSAERAAGGATSGPGMELLARFGYIAKGVVYLIIGFLAGRVALGDGGATTDRKGAIEAIYQQPFGKFLLGVVAVGLIGYALWCFIRAIKDPDNEGTDAKGIIARVGFAIIGVSYAALAYAALRLIIGASGGAGKSGDTSTQDWTAKLLQQSYGKPLVILGGLIVLGVALYLFYYAYKADFLKRFVGLSGTQRDWVRRLGRTGLSAQGIVFAEIGIFLIVAAQKNNAHEAKGIGGSLKQLAHEPYGHLLLGIVAIGLIAFGLYSFLQARFRRVSTV